MTNPKLIETTHLSPDEIDASNRLRPVSEAGIEGLIASIEELGLIKDEIIVRKIKRSGKLVLIAGAHRLEAARRMNIKVPAKIYECTDDWAALMEAHDNLANTELTALDLSIFLSAHQKAYEKIHPETKAGVAGGRARQNQQRNCSSFAEIVAEARGITPRQVRKIISAGNGLDAAEISTLRNAKKPISLQNMIDLAAIGNREERAFVCDALAEGNVRTASEARKTFMRGGSTAKPPRDNTDEGFKAILTAWRRASTRSKQRFVDECNIELSELLEAIQ